MAYDLYGGGEGPARPGSSGGGVGAGAAGATSTSAKKNDTWGQAVAVVYGCAAVKCVPLMMEANGTGSATLDGSTGTAGKIARAQYGLAIGEIASIDGLIYRGRLYGPTAIATHQLVYTNMVYQPGTSSFERPLGNVATAAEWSILSARSVDYRIPFGHLAHARIEMLCCPDGISPPPELRAVVSGFFSDRNNPTREAAIGSHWTINDANPADVITDLIENSVYGLGYPAGTVVVDVGADGAAESSYRRYCDAHSFFIALGLDKVVQVADVIAMILQATKSVGFWDGDGTTGLMVFKVVPLGDAAKTGNGVTFTPVLTALEVDDDHLIRDRENPVLVRRTPVVDTYNVVPVEWSRDTALRDSEVATVEVPDVASQDATGMRRSDPVSLPCIRTDAHARAVSTWLAQRSLNGRGTYEFAVTPRAAATIQVGDLLSLVHVPMGLNGQLVRVTETDENARGDLRVQAVEWHTAASITINSLPRLEDGA